MSFAPKSKQTRSMKVKRYSLIQNLLEFNQQNKIGTPDMAVADGADPKAYQSKFDQNKQIKTFLEITSHKIQELEIDTKSEEDNLKFLHCFEEIIKIRDQTNQIKAVKILLNYLVLD